jgi:hypothetical protein
VDGVSGVRWKGDDVEVLGVGIDIEDLWDICRRWDKM